MSIEIENKLDRIIQLLEELLQESQEPSAPTQGEGSEWHNPENVSIEQLGQGYRFLKPWEVETFIKCWLYVNLDNGWAWELSDHKPDIRYTYRVPITATIPPRP